MKQILLRGGLPLLAIATLSGCIDDKYDLSDIDTTSQFTVKDLVLPINIEPIKLGDIIEIKDGEQIKEVTINGETFYAVQESGTFESDPINIPGFMAAAPTLSPTSMKFVVNNTLRTSAKAPANAISIDMENPVEQPVRFSAAGIDPSILELTDIYTDNFNITLEFTLPSEITAIADIELENIMLDIPKGLTISSMVPDNCTYNDGEFKVPSLTFENGKAVLSLNATAINLPANNSGIDYNRHELAIDTKVDITAAQLMLTLKDNAELSTLSDVNVSIAYNISPIDVNAVSGRIQYLLEGDALNISPISLSSIPDFLSGDETNLILANPQIYLSVNNPVAGENLGYQTGLQLTAVRENSDDKEFSLDNGYLRVGYDKGVTGPYNFCLSPEGPTNIPDEYVNPQAVPFSTLGNVIAGNGIPNSIRIKLVDPQVYDQPVNKFKLNQNLAPLTGKWDFLAPLGLKNDSDAKIVYTKTVDGWSDDDVDAITINTLEVSLKVTNSTPLAAQFTGYPIDKSGKQISGVEIKGADIPGNAQDVPVTIYITGEVKNLDGITFVATVTPNDSKPLSPDQSFTLSDIKAKVSGNYTKEL
ncbi:MAG: hypothetical protein HDR88_09515 [Bacteroides sp.]|nr:hypothetical protein [Bacteroides sp.]